MPKLNRPYNIDEETLFASHPTLFKRVVDHAKVRKVLSTGVQLPGVSLHKTPLEIAIAGAPTPAATGALAGVTFLNANAGTSTHDVVQRAREAASKFAAGQGQELNDIPPFMAANTNATTAA